MTKETSSLASRRASFSLRKNNIVVKYLAREELPKGLCKFQPNILRRLARKIPTTLHLVRGRENGKKLIKPPRLHKQDKRISTTLHFSTKEKSNKLQIKIPIILWQKKSLSKLHDLVPVFSWPTSTTMAVPKWEVFLSKITRSNTSFKIKYVTEQLNPLQTSRLRTASWSKVSTRLDLPSRVT